MYLLFWGYMKTQENSETLNFASTIFVSTYRMARKFYMELKFYGFTIAGKIVKLKSVNFYYHATKILCYLHYRKI